ncbi:PREDICTED: SH3 domain-binding glutamic acid-rich-like protein [Aptenodytes forsteri]|uniref:SH3 domain-binding glutamic acid-rich-like protein n=1 Tax=Aptenodytes forsteri TaxID=9233 RepID=UPI0004F4424C|nr:PREDICTED: SH3 domain-binding glutamic acid-rich-like protein [Aptenodytes forsteri]
MTPRAALGAASPLRKPAPALALIRERMSVHVAFRVAQVHAPVHHEGFSGAPLVPSWSRVQGCKRVVEARMHVVTFVVPEAPSRGSRRSGAANGLPLVRMALPIKKQQQDVLGFLEANKIEFEEKDIAANEENRKWMRENVPEDSRPASGNPLPPRLFNDSRYLGDYEAFFEARENNAVYAFLGLTAPPGSKEAEALAKQQA